MDCISTRSCVEINQRISMPLERLNDRQVDTADLQFPNTNVRISIALCSRYHVRVVVCLSVLFSEEVDVLLFNAIAQTPWTCRIDVDVF